jgi:hypothetical protein
VQNVGGIILRCVLADDAIDQRAGTGPEQIDFDERILFLEHVNELFAFGDGDSRVPGNPPFLFRLGDEIGTADLSERRSKAKAQQPQNYKYYHSHLHNHRASFFPPRLR